jgi:protein SCO1/2
MLGVLSTFACSLAVSCVSAAEVAPVPPDSFYINFESLPLRDQDGEAFVPASLQGKLVLVNFVFTGCTSACPQQTRALVGLQRSLPDDLSDEVHFISLSLDPLSDSPAALSRYAKAVGAELRNWTFAVGRVQDLQRMTRQLRLIDPNRPNATIADHSTSVWLLGRDGRVMQRYAGNPPDTDRLKRELAALAEMQHDVALQQP